MTRPTQPIILTSAAIASTPAESFPAGTTGGNVTWKTLLSASKTPSNTFTSGVARCKPGGGHLMCHRHTQPEIYYITRGKGVVTVEGTEREVGEGDVVFIPGDAEHGIRNEDEQEELEWLYVFATDRFEDVVYRFSEDGTKARL